MKEGARKISTEKKYLYFTFEEYVLSSKFYQLPIKSSSSIAIQSIKAHEIRYGNSLPIFLLEYNDVCAFAIDLIRVGVFVRRLQVQEMRISR